MSTATVRDAVRSVLGADPNVRSLIESITFVEVDTPAPLPVPEFLAEFALPPVVSVIDRLVLALRRYRPNPPVYAEPTPRPGVALYATIPDTVDRDALTATILTAFWRGFRDAGSTLLGAHLDGSMDRFVASLNASETPAPPIEAPPTIWYHGNNSYSTDRINQYAVSEEENRVLEAYCEEDVAMDTSRLVDVSGVANVARVIARLKFRYNERFAGAIRTPEKGVKGTGGYYIRVRRAV